MDVLSNRTDKMDVSKRLSEAFEVKGLTLQRVSDATGINYRTIQRYVTGERGPSAKFLAALYDHFDISLTWVLTGEYDQLDIVRESTHDSRTAPENIADKSGEFVAIPRFDIAASAGHGALAETEIGTGHYAFNQVWLNRRGLSPSNLAVIAVRGDSMEPELYDQDLILLDRSQKYPRDGDMYVVRYFDELFVKRVQKALGRRYELLSSNRYYKPIEVVPDEATDLEFIGKVVASMHEW